MSAGTTVYPGAIDANTVRTNADEITSTDHNDHSVQIEAIEAKVGVNSSAVTTSHDYKLSGVTGTDKAVSKTGTETLTNKTLTSPLFQGTVDGWISANETWTYASATTVTVSGDVTTKYQLGDKVKLTQTSVKYFVIAAAPSYSAPNTTLTLHPYDSTTSVADAAITANYYSRAENPYGFPGRPRASVYDNSAQNNLTNDTWTQCILDAENYDIGSNFASNGFTAPITGYYLLNGQIQWSHPVVSKGYDGAIRVDDTAAVITLITVSEAVNSSNNMTRQVYITKGQVITMWARSRSGDNTVDLATLLNYNTYLDVVFLGVK